ncbi:GRIP and coiled-coil domain-containing protein 1-like [Watersipora subatra]|uniref:GRIP and coiled-coil domain-containing protein 1-like n=1 Tax=Watersipora subatra TaxID=2589382 RepID=UPI00355AD11C
MSESRSALLKTIENQQEKLHKYETKIKDLVAAYKSQVKENETLQSTIKSLRAASSRKALKDNASEDDSEAENVKDDESESQQREIERLSSSMTDLLAEKKNIQAAAIAERKLLKQEYEEKLSALDEQCQELKEDNSKNTQLAAELRKKVRMEQMEREREQTDHASMLRELNKNLNERITEREDLVHQIEDLKKELLIMQKNSTPSENYEVIIADMTNQLQEMRSKVKDYENRASQQVILGQLQHQISDIKKQHAHNIVKEQRRADEAEERLVDIGKKSEKRISELESKVSQLSDMVGNYEKLRYTDQTSIQKLKDRVTQLDQENTALARVANPEPDDVNLGIEELVDKLRSLKSLLREACETENSSLNYDNVVGELFTDETYLHRKCEEEYSQLKEEFERYKLRAQSVLKNKTSKDHGGNKEMEDLKNTVIELKERLRHAADKHHAQEQTTQQTVEDLRQSIANLHTLHRQELAASQSECQRKVSDAEQRLRQHRDRTILLLAEKDKELDMLKEKVHGPNPVLATDAPTSQEPTSPVEDLFTESAPSSQLIHFHQELSRNNLELSAIRKQKRDLEAALHELQASISVKEEQYEDQIAVLKEEVRRLDRSQSREGINLEYLKNIVYKYMTASEPVGKQAIFNAIATILHFSPQEKKLASSK